MYVYGALSKMKIKFAIDPFIFHEKQSFEFDFLSYTFPSLGCEAIN